MRIVHTADLHLGFRQYGFSQRMDDFMTAVNHVFTAAINNLKADAIVLAGDLFQSNYPPAASVKFLQQMTREAKDAGVRVLGIDGNHDATETAWLHVCGIEPLDTTSESGHPANVIIDGVAIAGINGALSTTFLERLGALSEFKHDHPVDVLVIHQLLAELCGFQGVDLTCAEVARAAKKMGTRIVLMGDVHDYAETVVDDVRFIYSGSVELTERGERPQKSFSVIDITPDSMKTAMYPIPTRPVFDAYIETDEQFDSILAQLETAQDGAGRLPLALIGYDPDLPGFKERATKLLQGRVIYQLIPMPKGDIDANIFAQLGQQTFERTGALLNLRDIISKKYPENTDQFGLITHLLEQPDNARGVVAQYVKTKGLHNLVTL